MTEHNARADREKTSTVEREAAKEGAAGLSKVEDLDTIVDRILKQAEPHLREGGVLARIWTESASDEAAYDFVEKVQTS